MRALVLDGNGVRVADNHPFAQRPGEARIKLIQAGVCATDLELIQGYMGFEGVLGHEWVGVVEDAPEADWIGQRVVGEINCPCERCPTCQRQQPTHCPDRTVLGILGRDGAFGEHLCLPTGNLHRVPESVGSDAAIFVEPLAAALQILEQVHIRPSHQVIVLGAGRLGQLCARVIALTGAHVTVVNRTPPRLALLPSHVDRCTSDQAVGLRADVVVDCTGSPAGLATATQLVRPRGTVVLKTTVHEQRTVPSNSWVIDEVTVVGSRCGPFAPALRVLASDVMDLTPLITARFSLDQGVEALHAAAQPEHTKVVLHP